MLCGSDHCETPLPCRPQRWSAPRRFGGVVPTLSCISGLNDEVTPVAIEARSVEHIVLSVVEVDFRPVGHEPVLVVSDEQVGVRPVKEGASDSLPGAEACTDQLDQFTLSLRLRTYSWDHVFR